MGILGTHKGFVKNFIDPVGFFGKREGSWLKPKGGDVTPVAGSQASSEDIAAEEESAKKKKLARAALIGEDSTGDLSQVNTGRGKLLGN